MALAEWLQALPVGELRAHHGIAAGMQNSNYFVETRAGKFVLTLFERIAPEELAVYLEMQAYLAARGIPCPLPLADAEGRLQRPLAGRPAALFTCLPGRELAEPDAEQCQRLGTVLAELHQIGVDCPALPAHPCGREWRQRVGTRLLPCLEPAMRDFLAEELAYEAAQDWSELPRGLIHADLFRDNVLWLPDGRLGGVLDFYFAGEDVLLFDLAVVANDWCSDETRLAALIAGYVRQRPLTVAEYALWPAMRRAAALRFWLLRLEARLLPRVGEVVTMKDPAHFHRMLERFRLAPEALPR